MQLVSCDKWEWISSDVELCSFSSFTYTHENNKRVTYVPSSHQNNSTHRTPSEPGGLNDDCHNDLKSEDPHKGNNKAEAINETCNFVNRFHIFHLPLFLTKDLWTRHQYSNNDIKITLNHFKSSYHLWCLALQQNLSIANSAVVSKHVNLLCLLLFFFLFVCSVYDWFFFLFSFIFRFRNRHLIPKHRLFLVVQQLFAEIFCAISST